jgi:glycosyltransferase involved in cell wall biosynthesis
MRNDIAKIAFIIPVYNEDNAEFFDQALLSVLGQTSNPFSTELRIYLGVDGPVNPSLEAVIQKHSSTLYKIMRNETCEGVGHILNILIRALEDEHFVFRMDSDDICAPDRVAKQLSYLSAHPEVQILGGAIREFETGGPVLGERRYPGRDRVLSYIRYACPLAHPTVVFRREALKMIGSYSERYGSYPASKFNQDILLWFKAIELGLIIDNISDVVLDYRISPSFYKRRSYSKAFNEFTAYVRGNTQLHGAGIAVFFASLRLLARLMPSGIVKAEYHLLPFRKLLLNHQGR